MKFSLMTYTMHPVMNSGRMSLLDVLKFASSLGFDAIEFSIPDFDRDSVASIKQALADLALKVSCINGTYSLAARSDVKFQTAVANAQKMVDIAISYHCDRVMYVPAFGPDIEGFEDRSRAAARIAEGLREIVKYANGKHVFVTVEDFPSQLYPLSTIAEVQSMLDSVPGLKLTLDNGNFLPGGDNLMEAYARFKPYIENVHLKDWEFSPDDKGILCRNGKYIRGGSHGKGLMDQRELLTALKNDGYPNYLAFEYEGILDHEEETRKGFQYLRSLSEN
jgi:sugar phosphate isomerase/epimerase